MTAATSDTSPLTCVKCGRLLGTVEIPWPGATVETVEMLCDDCAAASGQELILRDEAIEALLGRLDNYAVAELHVAVDHGEFIAWIEGPEVVYVEGDRLPILTDALVSLERRLRGFDA